MSIITLAHQLKRIHLYEYLYIYIHGVCSRHPWYMHSVGERNCELERALRSLMIERKKITCVCRNSQWDIVIYLILYIICRRNVKYFITIAVQCRSDFCTVLLVVELLNETKHQDHHHIPKRWMSVTVKRKMAQSHIAYGMEGKRPT